MPVYLASFKCIVNNWVFYHGAMQKAKSDSGGTGTPIINHTSIQTFMKRLPVEILFLDGYKNKENFCWWFVSQHSGGGLEELLWHVWKGEAWI